MQSRPLRDLGAQDAYASAIERDTLQGYEEFLAAYPSDPLANRIRALLAARREAMTWRRTYQVDTPAAYWSYLKRYPGGPHVADARRRLAALAAAADPPPSFAPIAYDIPPPPPPEIVYVNRPVLVFDDPIFGFVPPPPIVFLAPPPVYLVFPPPLLLVGLFLLPFPSVFVPLPLWCGPPPFLAPPVNNFYYNNIHNTVIVNNTTKTVTVKDHSGKLVSTTPIKAGGVGAPALPPSVAKKAERVQPSGAAAHLPSGVTAAPGKEPLGHQLPGMGGHALPPLPGKAAGAKPPVGVTGAKPPGTTAPASTLGSREPPPHALPLQPKGHGPTGELAAPHQLQQRIAHARPPARFHPVAPRPARAVHAPVRHAPAYRPPVRRAPAYHPPTRRAPAYRPPVRRAPAFHAPAYRAPPPAVRRR